MSYTKKQMSDACKMLVAAELTLAGISLSGALRERPGGRGPVRLLGRQRVSP